MKNIGIIIFTLLILVSCGGDKYNTTDNQKIRQEILKTEFSDKDVIAIEIVEIEHPMLGGIVSTIQLNDEQKKKFLADFDKLKNKGIYKCKSNYVIRIILESKTLKLKVCGTMVSNREKDIYYELPNGKSIIHQYSNK